MSAQLQADAAPRDFKSFAAAITDRINYLTSTHATLFVADIDGQAVWDAYLAAFPEGTNPIYRVRTEHDGSYDRNFVRRMGNIVGIGSDGQLRTIWDALDLAYPYNEVCAVLSAKIKTLPVRGVFLSKESDLGYVRTTEPRENGYIHTWYHFNCKLPPAHVAGRNVDETLGRLNTDMGVFRRGLETLKLDAVDTILDLIEQGALYRGAEFQDALRGFRKLKTAYMTCIGVTAGNRFLWQALVSESKKYTLIRNTVIGQLLQDLSEGIDVETAVRSYERMVAPTNYKRPTALITQRMVDDAAKTLADLGLESALERRHAVFSDINVNDVLWVNNSVQDKMKGGIAGLLAKDVTTAPVKVNEATDITIHDFLANVLPKATAISVMLANRLQNNMVSLTAPVHADAPTLFKWGNGIGWSYRGNITDSIKEKVKAAGGNVDAKLRVSLAWNNYDDLDLHAVCPGNEHVNYSNKCGILDVDMNAAGNRQSRQPVENMAWAYPRDGVYLIKVNNYVRVETVDQGFTLEVANGGKVTQYSFRHNDVRHMDCLRLTVKGGIVIKTDVLIKDMECQAVAKDCWGLTTEQFVKVQTLMVSPNYWDEREAGNKHWFFVLEGCVADEPVRGIYNEFLRPDLEKHRKVFEVLGNRTKCAPATEQLSGLGFSSTQRNTLIAQVSSGQRRATYNIHF